MRKLLFLCIVGFLAWYNKDRVKERLHDLEERAKNFLVTDFESAD